MGQLAFRLLCKEGHEGRGAGVETGRRLLQGSGQAVTVAWTRVSATRLGRSEPAGVHLGGRVDGTGCWIGCGPWRQAGPL